MWLAVSCREDCIFVREANMSSYKSVVVGTDGSASSLKAVERAGELATTEGARLHIACAYVPGGNRSLDHASDALGSDAYQIRGGNPAEEIVRTARETAQKVGAAEIVEHTVEGAPVEALLELATRVKADLIVVGNKGLNSLAGRLLGSVPSEAARRADVDVLIVHTV